MTGTASGSDEKPAPRIVIGVPPVKGPDPGVTSETVGGGGRAVALQFQGKGIYNNQYFVVKISAHKDWTGYLSRIAITY